MFIFGSKPSFHWFFSDFLSNNTKSLEAEHQSINAPLSGEKSTVGLLPGNRMMSVSCSPEGDFSVMLWQHARSLTAKRKNTTSRQSARTCWTMTGSTFLLAPKQSGISHEPAAWHALGCATSPSCHPQRIKPSVDYQNLCPLWAIWRLNPRRPQIGYLCFTALIMAASHVTTCALNYRAFDSSFDMGFQPLFKSRVGTIKNTAMSLFWDDRQRSESLIQ